MRGRLRSTVNPGALARGLLDEVSSSVASGSAARARGDILRPTARRSSANVEARASYAVVSGRSPRPVIDGRRTFTFEHRTVSRGGPGSPVNRAAAHIDYILRDSAIAEERADALLGVDQLAVLAEMDERSVWRMDAAGIENDLAPPTEGYGPDFGLDDTADSLASQAVDRSAAETRGAPTGASPEYLIDPDSREPVAVFADDRMAWTNMGNGRASVLRTWREIEREARAPGFDQLTLQPVDSAYWERMASRRDCPAELKRALSLAIADDGQLFVPLSFKSRDARAIVGWLLEATPARERAAMPGGRLPLKSRYGRGGAVQHRIIAELPWRLADARHPDAIRLVLEDFATRLQTRAGGADLPWVAAVHRPYGHNDPRNWHVHFVYHDRPFRVGDEAPSKAREIHQRDWLPNLRADWAEACNARLRELRSPILLDPRRTEVIAAEAGIDPMWMPPKQTKLPPAAAAADRRGVATVQGAKAGLAALRSAHLRADRRAAAAAAGSEAVAVLVTDHLSRDDVAEAHAIWQAEHARAVENERAAFMLEAHAAAAARAVEKAVSHWSLTDIAAGRRPLSGPLVPSDGKVTTPALARPDLTVRTLQAIGRASGPAFAARDTLKAEADAARAAADRARREAAFAWLGLSQSLPKGVAIKAAAAYCKASRDEAEIAHAGRLMREFDRLADRHIAPPEREVARKGLDGLPHVAARLAPVRRRRARLVAVAVGRAMQDRKCMEALAAAAARGKGLEGVAAPTASPIITRSWKKLLDAEPLEAAAKRALDALVRTSPPISQRYRRPILAHAERVRREARGAAFHRRVTNPGINIEQLSPKERAAAIVYARAREEASFGVRFRPAPLRPLAGLIAGLAERQPMIARPVEAPARRTIDEAQRAAMRIAATPRERWPRDLGIVERRMAEIIVANRAAPRDPLSAARPLRQFEQLFSGLAERQRVPLEVAARAAIPAVPMQLPVEPRFEDIARIPTARPRRRIPIDEHSRSDAVRFYADRFAVPAPNGAFETAEALRIADALLAAARRRQRYDQIVEASRAALGRADAEALIRSDASRLAQARLLKDVSTWTRNVRPLYGWRPSPETPARDAYMLVSATDASEADRRRLAVNWARSKTEFASPAHVPLNRREEMIEVLREHAPENLVRFDQERTRTLDQARSRD